MAGVLLPPWTDPAPPQRPLRAVAFDAFPILDPRPVFALAETLFPGKGSALSDAWRTRQFEYQWLRALMGRYADFWRTTEDALVYAAELLKLELTPARRAQLMQAYLELGAWPDVGPALKTLKERGLRLAFLSNMTEQTARGRDQERRAAERLRRGPEHRQDSLLQARSSRLSDGSRRAEVAARGDPLRLVCGVGRRGSEVFRLSRVLGEQARPPAGGAGPVSGWIGARSHGPRELHRGSRLTRPDCHAFQSRSAS